MYVQPFNHGARVQYFEQEIISIQFQGVGVELEALHSRLTNRLDHLCILRVFGIPCAYKMRRFSLWMKVGENITHIWYILVPCLTITQSLYFILLNLFFQHVLCPTSPPMIATALSLLLFPSLSISSLLCFPTLSLLSQLYSRYCISRCDVF